MREHNLAFIDIETTGLDVLKNEIIELACVITGPDLEVIEEFEAKIKPKNIENADPVALKVNHYNDADWENAQELEPVMKAFAKRVKDCIMVGHNVTFDSGFLEYTFSKVGIANSMHYHKLDTISIAWAKLHREPDLVHFSLRELCARFGVDNPKAHTALSDARATLELYKKLMSI